MEILRINKRFPCPVCARPLEVRVTKKDKPYVICDPCGVQLFIRGPAGIEEFARLIEQGSRDGLPERLEEMERRYRLTCPECGAASRAMAGGVAGWESLPCGMASGTPVRNRQR